MRTEDPRTIALKDYRPPDYRIGEIALDFKLDPSATRVIAKSRITRASKTAAPLVLQGELLKLISVAIDGRNLDASEYTLDAESLTLPNVPEQFTLEI
ncbi:MAG: aminopeptidase N, partial [Alphaproteobacteria bacterium]|nr:aminopeptidase N [Alphaproteobacteria bacterium]